MKKWIHLTLSLFLVAAFLLAYQNCGKGYQFDTTTQLSEEPIVDEDATTPPNENGAQDDDSAPPPTNPTPVVVVPPPPPTPTPLPPPPAPFQCAARSPLKNQMQNLGSVVDRVAILNSFPMAPTASPNCTLQTLPDTRFRPPVRETTAHTTYVAAWHTYASYVMRASENHLRLPPTHTRKAELANCALEHLYQLATRNIFAEPRDSYADNQGEYERNWLLASFNTSFDKIRRESTLPSDRLNVVTRWLENSGLIVMDKFNRHIAGRTYNQNSNLYWAGVTLMVSGLNTSNATLYNRGLEFIRIGLDQVRADGVLPVEMSTGAVAFRQHVFSVQPLLYAAQIARLNNLDLFSYRNNALMRLTQLIVSSFRDFSQFQRLTPTTQTYLPSAFLTQAPWDLVWMEIYFSQTGDMDLLPYLNTMRPFSYDRIGNTTYMYGLVCLVAL